MLEKLPHAIGAALRGVRPGLEGTIAAMPGIAGAPDTIRVTSPAFADGNPIPARYTEDGDGLSPPLAWSGIPPEARSVVLAIEDADSPTPHPLVHALLPSLPPGDGALAEGALPRDGDPDDAPPMGRNSFLGAEYLPPDPPPGHGPHRYVIQVFALDIAPVFGGHPGRGAVVEAMRGHVVARGQMVGTYERD